MRLVSRSTNAALSDRGTRDTDAGFMIAFSTEPEDLQRAPAISSKQALVAAFTDELRARLAHDRVVVTVDYASFADTPEGTPTGVLHQHATALAAAIATHLSERSSAVVQLSLSGMRTSGSIHLELALEHTELLIGGLAEAMSAHGGALLEYDRRHALVAFYPQLIAAADESISPHR